MALAAEGFPVSMTSAGKWALGERIAVLVRGLGGLLMTEDFAEHRSEWVEPFVGDPEWMTIEPERPTSAAGRRR